ncbi:hypothetical protein ATO6_14260 [Oceanicola sp. 22II-s10i]|uniref:OpgC family protein n=1 Tax=Oceanicola sp. 22II-s10i TaxID=1317116 RepID=UPI000B527D4B|nr:OpgC domain-containing protein [Oceanicola sp. 22II-s10i]OWU84207.1 hypothetical protein ATO6_14260 [Oceanicola sp. 22II-s10i]
MSRPETGARGLPARAAAAVKARDPRLDTFRGLALVMILIDHMPGNPYEQWTYRTYGFSDAAEAFFVLSGIAAGLAYSPRFAPDKLQRDGLWPATSPLWKRAWTLYLVHLLLTLWAIVIFSGGADLFGDPGMMQLHNLGAVFENPEEIFFGIATLGHQIGYVNILSVYALLLLFAPLAILVAMHRPGVVLAASAGLWFVAGTWNINLQNYPNGGVWFFNPLSWQLIFVIGLVIGIAMRRGERLVPVNRGLFVVALGWLVLVAAWRLNPTLGAALNHGMWMLDQTGLPSIFFSQDKTNLGLPRLLHLLAMVYVLSCLPAVRRLSAHTLAAPLSLMGRHGLLVFSLSVVLALAGQVVMMGYHDAAWTLWGLTPLCVAVMIAAAWVADGKRRRAQAAPAPAGFVPVGGLASGALPR